MPDSVEVEGITYAEDSLPDLLSKFPAHETGNLHSIYQTEIEGLGSQADDIANRLKPAVEFLENSRFHQRRMSPQAFQQKHQAAREMLAAAQEAQAAIGTRLNRSAAIKDDIEKELGTSPARLLARDLGRLTFVVEWSGLLPLGQSTNRGLLFDPAVRPGREVAFDSLAPLGTKRFGAETGLDEDSFLGSVERGVSGMGLVGLTKTGMKAAAPFIPDVKTGELPASMALPMLSPLLHAKQAYETLVEGERDQEIEDLLAVASGSEEPREETAQTLAAGAAGEVASIGLPFTPGESMRLVGKAAMRVAQSKLPLKAATRLKIARGAAPAATTSTMKLLKGLISPKSAKAATAALEGPYEIVRWQGVEDVQRAGIEDPRLGMAAHGTEEADFVEAVGKVLRDTDLKKEAQKYEIVRLGEGSAADVKAADVVGVRTADQPAVWNMTADEAHALRVSEEDVGKVVEEEIFGKAGAKKYAQLQRRANNTSNPKRADAASVEIEKMESALFPEQRRRLFGQDEGGLGPDTLLDIERSLSKVEDAGSPDDMAKRLARALSEVGEGDPTAMSYSEQVAYAMLKRGYEVAAERGWNTNALSEKVLKAAFDRFDDPNDAAFMLGRFRGSRQVDEAPEVAKIFEEGSEARARAGALVGDSILPDPEDVKPPIYKVGDQVLVRNPKTGNFDVKGKVTDVRPKGGSYQYVTKSKLGESKQDASFLEPRGVRAAAKADPLTDLGWSNEPVVQGMPRISDLNGTTPKPGTLNKMDPETVKDIVIEEGLRGDDPATLKRLRELQAETEEAAKLRKQVMEEIFEAADETGEVPTRVEDLDIDASPEDIERLLFGGGGAAALAGAAVLADQTGEGEAQEAGFGSAAKEVGEFIAKRIHKLARGQAFMKKFAGEGDKLIKNAQDHLERLGKMLEEARVYDTKPEVRKVYKDAARRLSQGGPDAERLSQILQENEPLRMDGLRGAYATTFSNLRLWAQQFGGPATRRMFRSLRNAELVQRSHLEPLLASTRVLLGSLDEGARVRVFNALEDVSASGLQGAEEVAAFSFLKGAFDDLIDIQNKVRASQGRRPIKRKGGYVTHFFKNSNAQAWETGVDPRARDMWNKWHKFRENKTGYTKDVAEAFDVYLSTVGRDVIYSPVYTQFREISPFLHKSVQEPFLRILDVASGRYKSRIDKLIFDSMAEGKTKAVMELLGVDNAAEVGKDANIALRKMTDGLNAWIYFKGLGLSPRAAIINLGQSFFTATDVGMRTTTRALSQISAAKGDEAKKLDGMLEKVLPDLDEIEIDSDLRQAGSFLTKVMDSPLGLGFFQRAEKFNRRLAGLAGLNDAVAKGILDVNDFAAGKVHQAAIEHARNVVERTQFWYLNSGRPTVLSQVGKAGRPFFAFKSFPLRSTDFFVQQVGRIEQARRVGDNLMPGMQITGNQMARELKANMQQGIASMLGVTAAASGAGVYLAEDTGFTPFEIVMDGLHGKTPEPFSSPLMDTFLEVGGAVGSSVAETSFDPIRQEGFDAIKEFMNPIFLKRLQDHVYMPDVPLLGLNANRIAVGEHTQVFLTGSGKSTGTKVTPARQFTRALGFRLQETQDRLNRASRIETRNRRDRLTLGRLLTRGRKAMFRGDEKEMDAIVTEMVRERFKPSRREAVKSIKRSMERALEDPVERAESRTIEGRRGER